MRDLMGHFEQLVLLTILQLDDDALGVNVREELRRRTGRSVSRGALYTTLDRLQTKGLLSWTVSDSTPERGGLPRRRFAVTPEGVAALRHTRDTLLDMWTGLENTLRS